MTQKSALLNLAWFYPFFAGILLVSIPDLTGWWYALNLLWALLIGASIAKVANWYDHRFGLLVIEWVFERGRQLKDEETKHNVSDSTDPQ